MSINFNIPYTSLSSLSVIVNSISFVSYAPLENISPENYHTHNIEINQFGYTPTSSCINTTYSCINCKMTIGHGKSGYIGQKNITCLEHKLQNILK